eukprot:scaffold140_cov565-Prasinococcus_capsulatus_cf.AAC.20
MGWDAFGLPAEQYALQTGTHPRETTIKNQDRFRSQLKMLGFSYDWQREISTTDEKYYKWTQWIFLQLYKKGLAYQDEVAVNWCPALGTVLANEEVIDGLSERGGHPVERRPMRQWVLKITEYAERLLNDLDELDWSDSIKDMQRNWIGKSEGAQIKFDVAGTEESLEVFTTRPDTLFGATYMVLAPEHPSIAHICSEDRKAAVDEYCEAARRKSDRDRTESREKSGVDTGARAINPVSGQEVPVFVADYVLGSYGTGAIMAVPAHDQRDFDFAKAYDLPIKTVVQPPEDFPLDEKAYTGSGVIVNSKNADSSLSLDGLSAAEAKEEVLKWLESKAIGSRTINYKLRDWLFSRQRYWGEPFPIMFVDGEAVAVDESELPLTLPETEDFQPSETGESPLANIESWVNTVDPSTGKPARRETNTMPQWAGSCWYFLRYIDPQNDNMLVDPEKEKYWMPVDLYVGGAEHAVLHLLYARFWHKVLYDCGIVSTKEPFQRLVSQGMILGEVEYTAYVDETGAFVSPQAAGSPGVTAKKLKSTEVETTSAGCVLKGDPTVKVDSRAYKMSKSRGNVINPDDIVDEFGADSLRLYEMFMGPLRDTKTWSTRAIEGVHRFLARVWRTIGDGVVETEPTKEQLKALNMCIKRVTTETEELRFNTAIAAMMEFINAANKWETKPRGALEPFAILLAPYAPHVAEEMWFRMGHTESLTYEPWPQVDETVLVEDSITIGVQVNGKVRGQIEIPKDADKETAIMAAKAVENVNKFLEGKEVKKEIWVPGKILNIVVGK